MKEAMYHDLSGRYHGTQYVVLNKAAFLDARFKSLPFLKPEEKDDIATAIIEEAAHLTPVSQKTNDDTDSHGTPKPKRSRGEHVLLEILSDVFSPSTTGENEVLDDNSDPPRLQASLEMKAYMKEETTNDSPLQKRNAFRYPLLSKMAQRYLCIPATSVPSERVFSAAGHIVSQKSVCLLPTMLECSCFWQKIYNKKLN